MNQDLEGTVLASLPIVKMQDVMLARFIGREQGSQLGFDAATQTRLATAISEITRNVVQHAHSPGNIQFIPVANEEERGLRIIVSDKGCGFEHAENYLTGRGTGNLGAGIPGTSRLVEQFKIESAPSVGTSVSFEVWQRKAAV